MCKSVVLGEGNVDNAVIPTTPNINTDFNFHIKRLHKQSSFVLFQPFYIEIEFDIGRIFLHSSKVSSASIKHWAIFKEYF